MRPFIMGTWGVREQRRTEYEFLGLCVNCRALTDVNELIEDFIELKGILDIIARGQNEHYTCR